MGCSVCKTCLLDDENERCTVEERYAPPPIINTHKSINNEIMRNYHQEIDYYDNLPDQEAVKKTPKHNKVHF